MKKQSALLAVLLFGTLVIWSQGYSAQPPLPDTDAAFRVGPSAGGRPFVPQTPGNVIYAYPGEPGKFFIVYVGIFAQKVAPLTQNQALLTNGFDVAVSVKKGTATANMTNWGAGTPSVEGDPKCPSDASLPCLVRDVGFSNIDLYENPSPTNPVWKTGATTGPFDAAVEAAFRTDYSLPPTPSTQPNAEVEVATFHYGISDTVTPGQTYTIELPKSPNGVDATNGAFTRTIMNSLKIGGNDYSPKTLTPGTITIVARPTVTLNSAALKNVDGTRVCLQWALNPVPTGDCLALNSIPYDFCYGIHIFRDGQDIARFNVQDTQAEVDVFDFCDFTQTNTYKIGIRIKQDPNCQCGPACGCQADCAHCTAQILYSNELAVSRIPHLVSDISPDNWPYFKPLTELTVTSEYAFNTDCGLPVPGYDGPYTTTATACTGVPAVIKAACTDPNELCCSYGTGTTIGTSLWKIEVSCIDYDPFTAGDQPYQFIYDGKNNRTDTQVMDPNTVTIWYPGTGNGSANAFANVPASAPASAADPLNPRRIPSVFRVALVVVDPAINAPTLGTTPAPAGYIVARSQSLPINFGFRRGDSNRNTAVTLSDIVNMLNFWGTTGGAAIKQLDCACDVNDSGTLTLADVVYLINHVAFSPGGPIPPHPYVDGDKTPYFGMDPVVLGGTPAVPQDLIITNNVLFRCFHYCPCFNAEVRQGGPSNAAPPAGYKDFRRLGGDVSSRTEMGCCFCRTNHYITDDPHNEAGHGSCDLFKYDP